MDVEGQSQYQVLGLLLHDIRAEGAMLAHVIGNTWVTIESTDLPERSRDILDANVLWVRVQNVKSMPGQSLNPVSVAWSHPTEYTIR